MDNKKILLIIGLVTLLATILFGIMVIYNIFINNDNIDYESGTFSRVIDGNKLQSNNSAESCYVALGSVVYNATPVIQKYPEHKDYIVKACGKDGSSTFTVQKYQKSEISEQTIISLREDLVKNKLGMLIP